MKPFKTEEFLLAKPLFAAEVSSNHNRELDRCLKFVDVSADLGCGAVKFQLFKIDELFAPEALQKNPRLKERKNWELPVSFLPSIAEQCGKKNIQFSCTPFYLSAVEELYPYVDFYKIASYELMWDDLLIECAKTAKPVVISTGMAIMSEVEHSFEVLVRAGCKDITFLHCVSGYPAPAGECNLAAIETLRGAFVGRNPGVTVCVGWSDHSADPGVIYRAVHRWRADMIEFHIDIDGEGDEFKTGHCWLPGQMRDVIGNVRHGFSADGDGEKRPSPSEIPDRAWRADPSDGLRPLKDTRRIL